MSVPWGLTRARTNLIENTLHFRRVRLISHFVFGSNRGTPEVSWQCLSGSKLQRGPNPFGIRQQSVRKYHRKLPYLLYCFPFHSKGNMHWLKGIGPWTSVVQTATRKIFLTEPDLFEGRCSSDQAFELKTLS